MTNRPDQDLETLLTNSIADSETGKMRPISERKGKHQSASWIRRNSKAKTMIPNVQRRRSVNIAAALPKFSPGQDSISPTRMEPPSRLMARFKLPLVSTMERIHPVELWNSPNCAINVESPGKKKSPKPSPAPAIPLPPLPVVRLDGLSTSHFELSKLASSSDQAQPVSRSSKPPHAISPTLERRKQSIGVVDDSGKTNLPLGIKIHPDIETDWIQRYSRSESLERNACRVDEDSERVRKIPKRTSSHAMRRAQTTKELRKCHMEGNRTQKECHMSDQDGSMVEYNPKEGSSDLPRSSYLVCHPCAQILCH